jgi:glycosyltransferase involved in cell wall biosynthesis
MLIVITGAGMKASEEAACWIRDTIAPLFVINLGTCGLIHKKYDLAQWIRPLSVTDESDNRMELDRRFPLVLPEECIDVRSLMSVQKARTGNIPDNWKDHDAVDMECYAQAGIFRDSSISFHALKYATDYSDSTTFTDFEENLRKFQERMKHFFHFAGGREGGHTISVIIPVYNREATVQRAIDSVLHQTRRSDEIIVVNDASTDNTQEILKRYGDHIKVISLSENSGPSRARNEGAKAAKSTWLAFLDSDDCWEKDKLENQTDYLRTYPFYQIIQSGEKWIRSGKRVNKCKHHEMTEGWIFEQSLERCMISPSGVLMRKSLIEQYGYFDEGLPVCEDYDLWLKISRHHPVGLDPTCSVIKYGGHVDQLSRKYPAMDKFRVQALLDLLGHEEDERFRAKIGAVLKKKLNILIQGYEKRDRLAEAGEYRGMLRLISA